MGEGKIGKFMEQKSWEGDAGNVNCAPFQFVCFVVLNPRVLSANSVDLGLFFYINFSSTRHYYSSKFPFFFFLPPAPPPTVMQAAYSSLDLGVKAALAAAVVQVPDSWLGRGIGGRLLGTAQSFGVFGC